MSECFQLPRRVLNRKQLLAHGMKHALPLLTRVLPSAVQACVEAWDEEKGTEARQLLPRMERTAVAGEAQIDGIVPHNASSHTSHSAPAATPPANGGGHAPPRSAPAAATASRKRERKPSERKRKPAAARTSRARSSSGGAKKKREATTEVAEHVQPVQPQADQPSGDTSLPVPDVKAEVAERVEQMQEQQQQADQLGNEDVCMPAEEVKPEPAVEGVPTAMEAAVEPVVEEAVPSMETAVEPSAAATMEVAAEPPAEMEIDIVGLSLSHSTVNVVAMFKCNASPRPIYDGLYRIETRPTVQNTSKMYH